MAPATFDIPEGSVYIPRQYSDDRNQAAELLEAADAIQVDQAEIRTVTGGYHVPLEVAEKWSEQYDETPEVDGDETVDDVRDEDGNIIVSNVSLAGSEILGGEGAVTPPADETTVDSVETVPGTEDESPEVIEGDPLPDASDSAWTHAKIDEFAAKYNVSFDALVTAGPKPTREEKVAHILASIPAAEATPAE